MPTPNAIGGNLRAAKLASIVTKENISPHQVKTTDACGKNFMSPTSASLARRQARTRPCFTEATFAPAQDKRAADDVQEATLVKIIDDRPAAFHASPYAFIAQSVAEDVPWNSNAKLTESPYILFQFGGASNYMDGKPISDDPAAHWDPSEADSMDEHDERMAIQSILNPDLLGDERDARCADHPRTLGVPIEESERMFYPYCLRFPPPPQDSAAHVTDTVEAVENGLSSHSLGLGHRIYSNADDELHKDSIGYALSGLGTPADGQSYYAARACSDPTTSCEPSESIEDKLLNALATVDHMEGEKLKLAQSAAYYNTLSQNLRSLADDLQAELYDCQSELAHANRRNALLVDGFCKLAVVAKKHEDMGFTTGGRVVLDEVRHVISRLAEI